MERETLHIILACLTPFAAGAIVMVAAWRIARWEGRRRQEIIDDIRSRPRLTELALYTEMPLTTDGQPVFNLKVVGRPNLGLWMAGDEVLMWPSPDPTKRWRLFIQEDTRP